MAASGGNDAAIGQLVQAGFERHAAEVALISAKGDLDHAATLILSWGGAEPPPLPETQGHPPKDYGNPASTAATDAAETLRLRCADSTNTPSAPMSTAAAAGASADTLNNPTVSSEVPASSKRATEVEHRQRVFEKIREQKAKEAKKLKGETKRRREQELAMWKEQREDAKQRKGGSGRPSAGAGARAADTGEERKEGKGNDERPPQAMVAMRLPDGTSVTQSFHSTATLRDVVMWLQSNEPSAGIKAKVAGRELELRCPFPPPGSVVSGEELDLVTVEGVGLVPRGRLMVQFRGSAGVKRGEGGMSSHDHLDPSTPWMGMGRGVSSRRGVAGRGMRGGPTGGPFGGMRGGPFGGMRGGRSDGMRGAARGGRSSNVGRGRGGGFGGSDGDDDGDDDQDNAASDSSGEARNAGASSARDGEGDGGLGQDDPDQAAAHPQQQQDPDQDQEGQGEGGHGDGAGGENNFDVDVEDGEDVDVGMGMGMGGFPIMEGVGDGGEGGHVLGGGAGDDRSAFTAAAVAAAVREQRLARLMGGGGGGSAGGDEGGSGLHGERMEEGAKSAAVGTLQDMLIEAICQRIKRGGHHASYGCLDGATGEKFLQRLVHMRALTPVMLASFRGCPVAALSLDNSPRATNALLAELGRKVSLTSLSLANDDMITVEGIESLVRLRALATLDVSGCKVTNGWLKAIAKLPSLETLILRGCSKVADLGMLSLSRGAPSLTSLDLTSCTGVTDAGIAHLYPLVPRLESLRLEGLPELSDDGLDALFESNSSSTSPGQRRPLRLRLLSAAKCPGVSDKGLASVAESGASASLTELDVSGTSVTERGLVRLASEVSGGGVIPLRLKKIALPTHGRGVCGPGLGAIATMTELTLLDLEGCAGPGVTSSSLAAAISPLVRLRTLIVAMVPAFDDDALSAVCGSCHALESLNLNGTMVERATGLALLGSGLTDLALAHTSVDDDSMDAVASLQGLTTLTLRGTGVTGAGISRLSCLRRLRSLNIAGTRAAREGDGENLGYAVETLRQSAAALTIRV